MMITTAKSLTQAGLIDGPSRRNGIFIEIDSIETGIMQTESVIQVGCIRKIIPSPCLESPTHDFL